MRELDEEAGAAAAKEARKAQIMKRAPKKGGFLSIHSNKQHIFIIYIETQQYCVETLTLILYIHSLSVGLIVKKWNRQCRTNLKNANKAAKASEAPGANNAGRER